MTGIRPPARSPHPAPAPPPTGRPPGRSPRPAGPPASWLAPAELGQEVLIQDLVDRPRAGVGKSDEGELRLEGRDPPRVAIGVRQAFGGEPAQRAVRGEVLADLVARIEETQAPQAPRVGGGIVAPLQQVDEQTLQLTHDPFLHAPAQVLDLLRQVVDVQRGHIFGTDRRGLLLGPGIEIGVIVAHRSFTPYSQLTVSAATRCRPSGVRSTASALPPGVRVIVTSPFASRPLSEVDTLPLSTLNATRARTRA